MQDTLTAPALTPSLAASSALLDDSGEWAAFSRPCAGGQESFVGIGGMHCAACALTVEQAIRSVPGVVDVSVNGASHLARVVWSPAVVLPTAWFDAVARAGYSAVPATESGDALARAAAARLTLWRWLVAGFCMMQVMMYATPAYVAGPGEMTPDMTSLMRWASWVLTLPVMFFSCAPFFRSAWLDIRRGTAGMDVPVALGIGIAFAASTQATFGGGAEGEVWFDSITMFVFFLLSGRLLEQRLRDRTAGALEALSRRLPDSVERRDAAGSYSRVSVRRLVPGDVVRVFAGETFPADATLLEGRTGVDEALLTGESHPLPRGPGQAVLAGSHNLSATVLARIDRTGADTRYAAIVQLMREAAVDKPRFARLADRVAGPFMLAVLAAAALAAAWWWPAGPAQAIGIAIAVLIVTCPCALSLATPAATLAAAGALARAGVLARSLKALDAAAAIDTVIFDKTGTLTQDRMSVGVVHTRTGVTRQQALDMAASLARHSVHPASRALAAAAPADGWPVTNARECAGQGVEGTVGAGARAVALRIGSAAWCGAPPQRDPDGLRVVHMADDDGWMASFELDETVREDAFATLAALRAMGIRIQLLSGDKRQAVQRLALHLGVEWAWGGNSPEDKLAHVRSLQAQGHKVAMAGDGINDAPVLACADVSMSFAHAAPVSRAQADFVLLGEQLAPVADILRQARRTRSVVRQNLAWAAAYNAVCVPLAVMGWMPPWLAGLGMAGSSLLVVLNSARLARLK